MFRIIDYRHRIYDYFHHNKKCQQFFFDALHEEKYSAYYTSMYLLQDTSESLLSHRKKGFSSDPLQAYIEFWGVMQALIIQQDAILELYKAVSGKEHCTTALKSWQALRELRNVCAGHPARKNRPKGFPLTRTFMGRDFGGYSVITYEQWQAGSGINHPEVPFGSLIDEYAKDAISVLSEILKLMEDQWPQ